MGEDVGDGHGRERTGGLRSSPIPRRSPIRSLSPERARRLALGAQGFARPRPAGRVDRRHVRWAMDHLRVLQLDSVNVTVRSHYMPLFSRLGPYRRGLLDEMAYGDRAFFEYWGHEASFVPMALHPAMRHRMARLGQWRWVARMRDEHPGFIEAVEAQVRAHGSLSVGDLEDPGERSGPWWGWGKGKLALEYLFATGRLAVDRRVDFTRFYAAPEAVIPADVLAAEPLDDREAHRVLALDAMAGLGVATIKDIGDYWRLKVPELRPVLADLVATGDLEQVEVTGWRGPVYLDPTASVPRRIRARALLTPFDPVVWNRERALRLFDFHYRIEIYVPEPKRRWGYYVYPFLLGDELVGRVDLKAHRDRGVLEARATWLEPGHDRARVARELAEELATMAEWLGLGEVAVAPRGDLAEELARFV